jgi:signal transduction histidine kinase
VILQSTPVLLKSLGTAEQQRAATSRIARSAQHISTMVGDLLDVARTRVGGSLPLDLKPMDATAVCQQVVEELRELYSSRDIRYEVSASDDDPSGIATYSQAGAKSCVAALCELRMSLTRCAQLAARPIVSSASAARRSASLGGFAST